MGDHRLPKRVMPGEVENAGKHGPGGRGKNGRTAWQRIFCYFGITEDWNTVALD